MIILALSILPKAINIAKIHLKDKISKINEEAAEIKYFKNEYNVQEVINPNKFKTTIGSNGLANSYDNMFFNRKYLKEYTGRYGVYDYTKNNYKEIRKYVSDHLLIFAEFENKGDLDDKK